MNEKIEWTNEDREGLTKEVNSKMFDIVYRRYFPISQNRLSEDELVNKLTDKYLSLTLKQKERLQKEALKALMKEVVSKDLNRISESKVVKLLKLYAQENSK